MGLFDRFNASKKPGKQPGGAKTTRVSDYLTEKEITLFPAGPSKRQVFGSLLSSFELPDPGEALKSIMAREEAGSTVIASGLALPHARINGISTIKAALGICPPGIQYSSKTEDSVNLVLLFLGPSENMREHLAFLAAASALFQVKGLRESLLKQATAKAVLNKIKEAEKQL